MQIIIVMRVAKHLGPTALFLKFCYFDPIQVKYQIQFTQPA